MNTDTANAPLGVGKIVSESFSVLFGNIMKVVLLGFIPSVVGLIFMGLTLGWGVAFGTEGPNLSTGTGGLMFAVSTFVQIAIYGLTVALLVQLAYDAKLNRTRALPEYFSPALRAAFPIAILAMVSGFLAGLGIIALVIPGLWLYAVFSVMAPAVVIEKAGFGGLGRSARLTKGYRWPILGTLILVGLCTMLLSFVTTYVFGLVGAGLGSVGIGIAISLVLVGLINAFVFGLSGISVALIYARLREIKEGISIDDIASVFE